MEFIRYCGLLFTLLIIFSCAHKENFCAKTDEEKGAKVKALMDSLLNYSDEMIPMVVCETANEEVSSRLRRGDQVVIQGECRGRLLSMVSLENCNVLLIAR